MAKKLVRQTITETEYIDDDESLDVLGEAPEVDDDEDDEDDAPRGRAAPRRGRR